jgi:hypothetical protein
MPSPPFGTVAVLFTVDAFAEPGLLPRLLQPFAKRDLVPDHLHARRHGDVLRVELGLDAMPEGEVHLVAGNLRQVVGVTRVREARGAALRSEQRPIGSNRAAVSRSDLSCSSSYASRARPFARMIPFERNVL